MRCSAEEITGTKKRKGGSEFMIHVRNVTETAVKVNVPFGVMEREGRMEREDYRALREANRELYCAPRAGWAPESGHSLSPPQKDGGTGDEGFDLGEHEAI